MTTKGRIGSWPLGVPMIDIAHHRRRRRLDRARHRGRHADGGPAERGRPAGARLLRPRRRGADRHGRPPRARPHLPPLPARRRDRARRRARRARAIDERVAEPLGLRAGGGGQRHPRHRRQQHGRAPSALVSVERGHDPRDFSLVPFGGAGPLHGGDAGARCSACARSSCPATPACSPTFGLLGTEVAQRLRAHEPAEAARLRPRRDRRRATPSSRTRPRPGWPPRACRAAGRRVTRLADLRYRHQGFELTVPWPRARPRRWTRCSRRFHERHRQLYTYALADAPVEIVTLRVAAAGRVRRFTCPLPSTAAAVSRGRPARRRVYFAGAGWKACPCIDATGWASAPWSTGPAIVEQLDATTVVPPGQRATRRSGRQSGDPRGDGGRDETGAASPGAAAAPSPSIR